MTDGRDISLNSGSDSGGFPDSDTWGKRHAASLKNSIKSSESPAIDPPVAKRNRTKIGQEDGPPSKANTAPSKARFVSVEDVLNTANLNDRMEMARLRHAQILARRSAEKPGATPRQKPTDPSAIIPATGVPLLMGNAHLTPSINPTVAAYKATATPTPKTPPQASRVPIFILIAAVITLLIGVAVPGPLRDYAAVSLVRIQDIIQVRQSATATQTDPEIAVGPDIPVADFVRPSASPTALLVQMAGQTPTPEIASSVGIDWIAASITTETDRKLRTPFLHPLIQDARPSPILGRAVPNYALQTEPATPNVPILLTRLPAPDLFVRLADAVPIPGFAIFTGKHAVYASIEPMIDRQLRAPFVRPPPRDARPNPLLGRLVPNYILKYLPTPVAMAVFGRLPALADRTEAANKTQTLPIIVALSFTQFVAGPALTVPDIGALQFVSGPGVLSPELAVFSDDYAVLTPKNLPQFDVSLPVVTEIPRRPANPKIIMPAPFRHAAIDVPDTPAPYVAAPVKNRFHLSRLLVNAPASYSQEKVNELVVDLRSSGFPIGNPNRVSLTISTTNVRFFHAADAEAAVVLAKVVGGTVRNFTNFRPRPPLGTVEVWIAAGTPSNLPARTQTTIVVPDTAIEDPALLLLRNRLLDSLRAGDHL